MDAIMEDEHATVSVVAEKTGINKATVDRYIADMKKEGLLAREGSTKTGKWIVM